MASAYPTAKSATSSHTSGWGCQAGNGTSPSTAGRLGLEHRAREHEDDDAVDDPGADHPDHEDATEERLVEPHVHVPTGHEEELGRAHREQGEDDQVGVVGVDVRDRDLDGRQHDEHYGDQHVLTRRRVIAVVGVNLDLAGCGYELVGRVVGDCNPRTRLLSLGTRSVGVSHAGSLSAGG